MFFLFFGYLLVNDYCILMVALLCVPDISTTCLLSIGIAAYVSMMWSYSWSSNLQSAWNYLSLYILLTQYTYTYRWYSQATQSINCPF